VVELSRIGTIKDVARFLHLSWDTVKEIQKRYLYSHYNNPDITDVRHIGIDEFAVARGQVYKTIVVDLDTGRVIYIGDGKGGQALDGFWAKVKKAGIRIEAVTTDLSPAFISAVMTHLPNATLVFDHFHVVKLMNDAPDEIRRGLYRQEKDLNKRKVIKGTRWWLPGNGKDIFDHEFKPD
jgi:transposase